MCRLLHRALLISALPVIVKPQGIITTITGADFPFNGDGKPALSVALGAVTDVTTDSKGNVYLNDIEHHLVLKMGADGIVNVIAGNGVPGDSGDGGPATSASISNPTAIATDGAGNIYLAEGFTHRMRKVTPEGIISTFAGNGQAGISGDGGPAIEAAIGQQIRGMVLDGHGNLYIAESFEHIVRKVDKNGIITTVAGNGQSGYDGDGGPATQAVLAAPFGLALDAAGNLLISDSAVFRIRRVTPDGVISTIAGGGPSLLDGIPARTASLLPLGIAADASGNVYVGDFLTGRVRKIDTLGVISTAAGSGLKGYSGDGGPALAAAIGLPYGIAVDNAGNLLVGDYGNARVRKVNSNGVISTIAGNGQLRPSPDGAPGAQTALRSPWSIALDSAGNVIVSEYLGQRVRRITPNGVVSTIAGTGFANVSVDGGQASAVAISLPAGVVVDPAGSVYFSEQANFKVRKVSPSGVLSTAAGIGFAAPPSDGLPATNSPLGFPDGLALDSAGNLYICDEGTNLVRKVTPAGIISTAAGSGLVGFSGDGGPASRAAFSGPAAAAVDGAGNMFVSDRGNNRIRKISTNGVVTTVAGNGQPVFSGDGGPAINAGVLPYGIALDTLGNLFIAEPDNHRIRKVTPAGIISTVAGNGRPGSAGDGGLATLASLNYPIGVAVDPAGNIYIADTGNARVRVVLAASASFSVSTRSLSLRGSSTGPTTPSQNVQVNGSVAGLPFTVALSTARGGSWLRSDLMFGTMPRSLQISADPSQLEAGNYSGTVTISVSGANPATQTISVDLAVGDAQTPILSVNTDNMSFSTVEKSGSVINALTISNTGGGTIAIAIAAITTSGGAWLSVSPATSTIAASSPTSATVLADPTGLAPGAYLGRILITGSTGETVSVPATLLVSPGKQKLLLTSKGFTITAVAGGGAVPSQRFGIANSGYGTLDWTAAPDVGWLTLSRSSGSSDASDPIPQLVLTVNPEGLSPGTYYGTVRVSAPQADNSPQFVTAVLNVLPPGSDPGPIAQPSGLVFIAAAGGVSPGSQTISLFNPIARPLTFNSDRLTLDGSNWFVHLPATGAVTPSEPFQFLVQPEVTGLGPGFYSGVLTLLFSDQSVRTVNILFVVARTEISPSAKARQAINEACAPNKLALLFTSISSDFSGSVGWPTSIEVAAVDDCGLSMNSGSVVVSFNNGDPPVSLVHVGDGRWTGAWTPRSARTNRVTLVAKARSSSGLTGQSEIIGGLQANTGVPLLRPSAIVNTADPAAPLLLAPGSLISLLGTGLSESEKSATSLPLPLQLAGTSVLLAGRQLPLLSVTEGQINTLIPYSLPFNTQHQLLVAVGAKLTVPELVSVAPAQPVVLTESGVGVGQGLIYVTSRSAQALADTRNPAIAGDQILIRCTGLGEVRPTAEANDIPQAVAPTTANEVTLTIGGFHAQVLSASLSLDAPGVYDVRAIVPPGITPSDAAPVVLSAAGQTSPEVTMAVR